MIGFVQLQDVVEKWHFENEKLHIKIRISLKAKKQKLVQNQGKIRNGTS